MQVWMPIDSGVNACWVRCFVIRHNQDGEGMGGDKDGWGMGEGPRWGGTKMVGGWGRESGGDL